MTEAIAQAAEVPADEVRRAHQLGGSLTEVARAALGGSGLAALRGFSLQTGHPVRPRTWPARPSAPPTTCRSCSRPRCPRWD